MQSSLVTCILDDQADIVLLGKVDSGLDICYAADIDGVAGIITQSAGLRCWGSEWDAGRVLVIRIHDFSRMILTEETVVSTIT